MKQFLRARPTAEVAGVEYLARAMTKWPSFAELQTSGPAENPQATANAPIFEHRVKVGQHQWMGLLTWR